MVNIKKKNKKMKRMFGNDRSTVLDGKINVPLIIEESMKSDFPRKTNNLKGGMM